MGPTFFTRMPNWARQSVADLNFSDWNHLGVLQTPAPRSGPRTPLYVIGTNAGGLLSSSPAQVACWEHLVGPCAKQDVGVEWPFAPALIPRDFFLWSGFPATFMGKVLKPALQTWPLKSKGLLKVPCFIFAASRPKLGILKNCSQRAESGSIIISRNLA